MTAMHTSHRILALVSVSVLAACAQVSRHGHDPQHFHGHDHDVAESGLLGIDEVLMMPHNQAERWASAAPTRRSEHSGQGQFVFRVAVRSDALPEKVHAKNPYDRRRKRTCLDCAHGGFAYDHREGRGEVYWFLQGAGMMRVQRDRAKIELLDTDPEMLKFNMHNATFFEHEGKGRIAWPANRGARVFVTDVDGKLLHTIGRPTMPPYDNKKAGYAPTDTAYLDGKLWITDGYASKYVMAYDLGKKEWTDLIFGGRSRKAEPGKFGTNHGLTIHKGLLYVSGRFFARIHSYRPDTKFVNMFPLPEGSKPCDFEFFVSGGKLYGVAASLNVAKENKERDKGAAIYIVDMKTLKIVSTIRPKDELGLDKFRHLHNVLATVDKGVVTLFCQAWNGGDFAVLQQALPAGKDQDGKDK